MYLPIFHAGVTTMQPGLGNNTGNPTGTDRPTQTLSHAGAIPDLLREGMPRDYRVLCCIEVLLCALRVAGMLERISLGPGEVSGIV